MACLILTAFFNLAQDVLTYEEQQAVGSVIRDSPKRQIGLNIRFAEIRVLALSRQGNPTPYRCVLGGRRCADCGAYVTRDEPWASLVTKVVSDLVFVAVGVEYFSVPHGFRKTGH